MLRLALLSGFLGATASCLAKFAMSPDSPVAGLGRDLCEKHLGSAVMFAGRYEACDVLSWLPRGLVLLLMVGLNVVMVALFVEGMEESGSVAGTGLASAANFATSALYGILLWDEQVSTQWFLGFALVVLGVAFLSPVRVQAG